MARARRSHKRREEEVKTTKDGLETPYGQPGKNPYVIYVDYARADLSMPKVLILAFKAKYAAKFFLNQLISDDEWEWTDPIGSRACIRTSMGLRISMFEKRDLQMLLEYEPSEAESEWQDDQVEKYVQRLKYGRTQEDRSQRPVGDTDNLDGETSKPRREKKNKAEKVKIDKTGLISANDIAKELGVEGREVRGVLRGMKMEKPAGGWLFDAKTAEEIREKVKKGLKDRKKK